MAFSTCSATVVSDYAPYTRPAGGRSGATSHPRQGVGLIPVRPQPLDSLHFPPPSQLSPYLCQPQLQWLESWPDNSASCSPPVPRAAHRGPCPRASWVGGFPPHSRWRLGSEPWLTTPTRSGFWPCFGVCVRCSGLALRSSARCRSSVSSHPSARVHSQVVGEFLQQQVAAGFMMGPFEPQECSWVVTSSVGVVSKSTPAKFRVIVDLSRLEGASVNDQLLWELTHVAYSSIEDASLAMHALGQGAQLAKIDIRDAYHIILVHPEDRPFLAWSWQDRVYIDCQLPFGLASAPAIFSAVAEALEWILRRRGARRVLHYLDDILLMGAPGSHECSHALATTFSTCEELRVPLAMDKVEGPATSLTFLGIRLCSSPLSVSLPGEKITALRGLLQELLSSKYVRDVQMLESLVGYLVHATKVCLLAKPFLGGLFQVFRGARPGQPRRLNIATRADLAWWHSLLSYWPGVSTHQFLALGQPDGHLFTDASRSWGCGAWMLPVWLQVSWPEDHCLSSTALKELAPVVFAAAVWGERWRGQFILCHSDNTAVVALLNSLHARDPLACNMLRCLAFWQALYDFRLRAVHIYRCSQHRGRPALSQQCGILTPCHSPNCGVSHIVCCLLGIRGTLCLHH